MPTYLIIINIFFVALVITGVCGALLWAIATQRRDWPSRLQTAADQVEVAPEPVAVEPESVVVELEPVGVAAEALDVAPQPALDIELDAA